MSLTLSSPGLKRRRADAHRRPGHHAPAAAISGVATVDLVAHRARAGRGNPAARPAGHRRQRRAGGSGAAVTEPGVAGGTARGRLDERTIRLKGRLDSPADFKQLVVSQQEGASSVSAIWPTSATRPRSRVRSPRTTTSRPSASTSSSQPASARRRLPSRSAAASPTFSARCPRA